jgi:putative hydrolase of the HAD superfamily
MSRIWPPQSACRESGAGLGAFVAESQLRKRSVRQESENCMAAMKRTARIEKITCVFLDIGGVLLTDGWDPHARKRAAKAFGLNAADIEVRHLLIFDTYEEGRITLEEYLGRVVFHQKRPFTRAQFRSFMFAQSKPYPEMIELVSQLKGRLGLKIAVVSNEARELNAYRIRTFRLNTLVDFFVSSCFVHLRKPDADIFRLALDLAQVSAQEVVYIENTRMFVEIAEGLGIRSILHEDFRSTRTKLASLGLHVDASNP